MIVGLQRHFHHRFFQRIMFLFVCKVLLELLLPRLVLLCHLLRDVGVALLLEFELGLEVVLAVSLVDVLA